MLPPPQSRQGAGCDRQVTPRTVLPPTGYYLLWASATGISSLYHVSLESLNILKNWHQSFRFPDASENCSALILRTTCGAKDRVQRDGW